MENNLDLYLKRAGSNKEFQGLMAFVVREGDIFELDASEYKVHHRMGPNRGKILGAWARCNRKDKNTFLTYLEFEEHKEETKAWKDHLSLMMQMKAEEFVLKRAFPLEEITKEREFNSKLISGPQQRRMFAISGGQESILRQVLEKHGLGTTSQVTREKYEDLCNEIEGMANEFTQVEDKEHPWE